MKECSSCKQTFELSNFYKKSSSKDNLTSRCKSCIRVKQKEYYENNKRKILDKNMEYRKEHWNDFLRYERKRRSRNIEKIREQGRDWNKRNPDIVNAATARRRAKKKQCDIFRGNREIRRQIQYFYTEAERLKKETGISYEVDHIVPLQGDNVSGLHVPWNLQIITLEENRKKGNKHE